MTMTPRDTIEHLEGVIRILEARVAELRAALEPFAEAAMELHPGIPDDGETLDGIEVRHWRRAWSAYLAGARMAREQERADIHIPVIAVELATRFRHLLHSLPLNVRVQLGLKWELDDAFVTGVEVTLAKYRGEA